MASSQFILCSRTPTVRPVDGEMSPLFSIPIVPRSLIYGCAILPHTRTYHPHVAVGGVSPFHIDILTLEPPPSFLSSELDSESVDSVEYFPLLGRCAGHTNRVHKMLGLPLGVSLSDTPLLASSGLDHRLRIFVPEGDYNEIMHSVDLPSDIYSGLGYSAGNESVFAGLGNGNLVWLNLRKEGYFWDADVHRTGVISGLCVRDSELGGGSLCCSCSTNAGVKVTDLRVGSNSNSIVATVPASVVLYCQDCIFSGENTIAVLHGQNSVSVFDFRAIGPASETPLVKFVLDGPKADMWEARIRRVSSNEFLSCNGSSTVCKWTSEGQSLGHVVVENERILAIDCGTERMVYLTRGLSELERSHLAVLEKFRVPLHSRWWIRLMIEGAGETLCVPRCLVAMSPLVEPETSEVILPSVIELDGGFRFDDEEVLRVLLGDVRNLGVESLFAYYRLFLALGLTKHAYLILLQVESLRDATVIVGLLLRSGGVVPESEEEDGEIEREEIVTTALGLSCLNVLKRMEERGDDSIRTACESGGLLKLFENHVVSPLHQHADLVLEGDVGVTWSSVVCELLVRLRKTGTHSSVTLVSSDRVEIPAHVSVLVWKTNFFRGMMEFSGTETSSLAETGKIEVGMDSDVLSALLDFVYLSSLNVEPLRVLLLLFRHASMYAEATLSDAVFSRLKIVSRALFERESLRTELFAHGYLLTEDEDTFGRLLKWWVDDARFFRNNSELEDVLMVSVREMRSVKKFASLAEGEETLRRDVDALTDRVARIEKMVEEILANLSS